MHVPDKGERVRTPDGVGTATGVTGKWNEHYEIRFDDGETQYFHYEDIEEYSFSNERKPVV